MQHPDYPTDKEWHEKYKDLSAEKRSEVVELRKAAMDYVDFHNPYRKEMEAAWRLPDGYEDEQIEDALSPLAAYLPKAMSLYEKGDAINALGICFDLFDILTVIKSCEPQFFIDSSMSIMYPWALAESTLYPICKIYNDKNVAQEIKTEIFSRIEAYGKLYNFPEKLGFFKAYKPEEVFNTFGTFDKELEFYYLLGLNPYNIHEVEEAKEVSDEEFETWRLKIFKEVSCIGDYHKLSTEELSLLSNVLMDMCLFTNEEIEQACSLDHFHSCIDGVKAELSLRGKQKENNLNDDTLRSWASSQNKDGSWTGISVNEAYNRIIAISNTSNSIEGFDKDRITFLAYNYYSPTPCTTAKELHAKFMAYETKHKLPEESAPAFAHRQALAMLQSDSLSLADRLLLYDILL